MFCPVTYQQVSTFPGTAPLEQDRTGSAVRSQFSVTVNLTGNRAYEYIPNAQV